MSKITKATYKKGDNGTFMNLADQFKDKFVCGLYRKKINNLHKFMKMAMQQYDMGKYWLIEEITSQNPSNMEIGWAKQNIVEAIDTLRLIGTYEAEYELEKIEEELVSNEIEYMFL